MSEHNKLEEEINIIKNDTGIEVVRIRKYINTDLIPNCCGVYIIETDSGKIYVGSSTNIYKRISSQKSGYIEDHIRIVNIYITKTEIDARSLEQWFIYKLNPELNIRKPTSDGIKRIIPGIKISERRKIRLNVDNIDSDVIGLIHEYKCEYSCATIGEALNLLVKIAMEVADDTTIDILGPICRKSEDHILLNKAKT